MYDVISKPNKTKSIALAIILNATPLVIFGLGYLYIGKWKRFIVVEFLQLFSLIAFFAWGLRTQAFVGILWVGSMIDILIQTGNYNEQRLKPIR